MSSYRRTMTTPTPPEVLIDLSSAHIGARALHVAADLAVADLLDDNRRTALALAAILGVDADALSRILRLLEAEGIFRRDDTGAWAHTEISRWLRSDHPASLRDYVRMSSSTFNWGAVTHLDHAVRTGTPGMCVLDDHGWLSYLERHADESRIFQASMTAKAHADIAATLAVYDFSRYDRIVDVGGGHGHLLHAILQAHPATTGILFEQPSVAQHVQPTERLHIVAGDFFTDPLPAGSAYVLMNIIHDWDDDAADTILTAVADAGRQTNARVLLLEAVLPEGPTPHRSKILDVLMLAITGGRERTGSDYRHLLDKAGLDLTAILPTATAFSVIEAAVR